MLTVIDKIKSALFSRKIPFNVYEFDNNSIVVISVVRGRKLSINLAHQLSFINGLWVVSDFTDTYEFTTESQAVSRVLSLIRKEEINLSKHTKK